MTRLRLPGLIDAHVHIESSLLAPAEYARLVLSHGTTPVIADPHEIANVCGTAGIAYMLASGAQTPPDILIIPPPCVPAPPPDLARPRSPAPDQTSCPKRDFTRRLPPAPRVAFLFGVGPAPRRAPSPRISRARTGRANTSATGRPPAPAPSIAPSMRVM